MGKHRKKILCVLILGLMIATSCGHSDRRNQDESENKAAWNEKSATVSTPPEISLDPVSEEDENEEEEDETRQDNFDRLSCEEDVIVFAKNGFPDGLLNDKSLFRVTVTDVVCNEKDIIVSLLNKYDKTYLMNDINFESVFTRHDVLRELTGIEHAGNYYCTFCKINMEIERIWTYDYDSVLSLDKSLFSAKCYSEILDEYTGTEFDSNTTLFFADDCKVNELLFDKDKNSYQVEVITVIHYDEYNDEYDDYSIMFDGDVVGNGMFNVRALKESE